jgi:hypothetical protein
MMSGDLFVKAREQESLQHFACRMAALIEVGNIERRESSSYVGEEYYKGVALSVVVKFARADEVDLDGYEFWIHLQPSEIWIEDPTFVDGLADLLARRLTLAGERVVRMPNAERVNSRKILYGLNESVAQGSKGRVTTTDG